VTGLPDKHDLVRSNSIGHPFGAVKGRANNAVDLIID
jgi:hypothetical protein